MLSISVFQVQRYTIAYNSGTLNVCMTKSMFIGTTQIITKNRVHSVSCVAYVAYEPTMKGYKMQKKSEGEPGRGNVMLVIRSVVQLTRTRFKEFSNEALYEPALHTRYKTRKDSWVARCPFQGKIERLQLVTYPTSYKTHIVTDIEELRKRIEALRPFGTFHDTYYLKTWKYIV